MLFVYVQKSLCAQRVVQAPSIIFSERNQPSTQYIRRYSGLSIQDTYIQHTQPPTLLALHMDFEGDVLGYWGRNIIEDYHDGLLKKLPSLGAQLSGQPTQPPRPGGIRKGPAPVRLPPLSKGGYGATGTVGILGAGVGGLYTAIILDSLGIKYEILEASNRTGGRLFTYKFPNGEEYDYYVCHPFDATT
jgi:hypothetical protein